MKQQPAASFAPPFAPQERFTRPRPMGLVRRIAVKPDEHAPFPGSAQRTPVGWKSQWIHQTGREGNQAIGSDRLPRTYPFAGPGVFKQISEKRGYRLDWYANRGGAPYRYPIHLAGKGRSPPQIFPAENRSNTPQKPTGKGCPKACQPLTHPPRGTGTFSQLRRHCGSISRS